MSGAVAYGHMTNGVCGIRAYDNGYVWHIEGDKLCHHENFNKDVLIFLIVTKNKKKTAK